MVVDALLLELHIHIYIYIYIYIYVTRGMRRATGLLLVLVLEGVAVCIWYPSDDSIPMPRSALA